MTYDNGMEMANHQWLTNKTGIDIYFAHPYSSWERGTNENTNGLIRQYLPKGTSMKRVTQDMCDLIAKEINERPRKRLGYTTPFDHIQEVA